MRRHAEISADAELLHQCQAAALLAALVADLPGAEHVVHHRRIDAVDVERLYRLEIIGESGAGGEQN
jgi:hypothetical protein